MTTSTAPTYQRWLNGELPYVEVRDLPVGSFFKFWWQVQDEKDGIISEAATFQLVEKSTGRAAYRHEHSQTHRTHFITRDPKTGEQKTVDFERATTDEKAMALGTQVVPVQVPAGQTPVSSDGEGTGAAGPR
jgi:hypothetical protein